MMEPRGYRPSDGEALYIPIWNVWILHSGGKYERRLEGDDRFAETESEGETEEENREEGLPDDYEWTSADENETDSGCSCCSFENYECEEHAYD